MTARHDVIVIGAGANGLVAATALARAGRRVLVVEADAMPGGTWRPIEVTDAMWAPIEMEADWIPPAVASLVGLTEADMDPAPPTSVVLDDGGLLTLAPDAHIAAAAIRKHSPRDADRWPEFTSRLRQLSRFLETMYQLPAPDVGARSVSDYPALFTLGRSFRALGQANMSELLRILPMPVQDLADDFLTFEPLKAAVAAAGIRDIRQGPRSGGTSFVLLHYLTGGVEGALRGRRQLRAGPYRFIEAALEAATKAGVVLRREARVARIEVADDAVRGVTLATGETISAATVVSTADPSTTLLDLVDPVWLDPEFTNAVRNIRYRGCAAAVLYALDRDPGLPEGIVSLSSSTNAIERPFDACKYGGASPRPHIELRALPQARLLLARVQYIPFAMRDGEWDDARKDALARLVSTEIRRAIPAFDDMIVERRLYTPADLAARFAVRDGAMTHGEMGLDQILFMRPVAGYGRHAMPIAGLYLGGAGTHPGPGIAGGPGFLAGRQMLADSKKRR